MITDDIYQFQLDRIRQVQENYQADMNHLIERVRELESRHDALLARMNKHFPAMVAGEQKER